MVENASPCGGTTEPRLFIHTWRAAKTDTVCNACKRCSEALWPFYLTDEGTTLGQRAASGRSTVTEPVRSAAKLRHGQPGSKVCSSLYVTVSLTWLTHRYFCMISNSINYSQNENIPSILYLKIHHHKLCQVCVSGFNLKIWHLNYIAMLC